ncbi:MAG: DUF4139 domain-containing protein [Spirochaetes bacterium]|nr:DUF4139 domain-containing protein [Spirochaetota bacterium]
MKNLILFSVLFMATAAFCGSGNSNADSNIRKVVVFKNGIGFYNKILTVKTPSDKIVTDVVSNAILGTVWITSSGAQIEKISALEESGFHNSPVQNFYDLISANIGKKVKVMYSGNVSYEGSIIESPDNAAEQETGVTGIKSPIIYLDNGKQVFALYASNIISMEFLDRQFSKEISRKKQEKKICIYLAGKTSSPLSISYMQRGISWTPSYLIDISKPSEAVLSMKAVLVNDSDDLDKCEVDLAVGYPNFMYQNVDSPMTLSTSLTSFLSRINGSTSSGRAGLMANMAYQNSESYNDDEFLMSIPDAGTDVSSSEDFHLYSLKNVTAKKGERVYYNIFSKKIRYEHLYTWDIPETASVNSSGYYQSLNADKKEQVWHIIKLKNSTSSPWTTATAFTVSRNKPVAQDMLNYTPAGTDARVKLTISSDIKTDRKEEELGREQRVKIAKSSTTYDDVRISGELYIKNTKNENISVEITKKITGEVTEADMNPKIIKEVDGLNGVNFKTSVKWVVNLKKGENKTIKYRYKIYVRN